VSEEEEPPGLSEEEEEPPAGVEEEPSPTSPPSHPMKPLPSAREEERCGGGWSFIPHGVREEEWCGSREKQTTHSGLGPASCRALNAC
jgi:hypothetical protein